MGIIRFAIDNPVKVAVGVLLLILFGMLALLRIPIQLTPDVDRQIVRVETIWQGASPQEVEEEIVKRQEEKLKDISGLTKMTSMCMDDRGQITLEFFVGVEKEEALNDVRDRINQVTGTPTEAEKPAISSGAAENENTIAWLMFEVRRSEAAQRWVDDVTALQARLIGAIDAPPAEPEALRRAADAAALDAVGLARTEMVFDLADMAAFADRLTAVTRAVLAGGAGDAAGRAEVAGLAPRAEQLASPDVTRLFDFVEDNVKPVLKRVEGVGTIEVYGGRERECHVTVHPERLAARGITYAQLRGALQGQNVNISAGTTDLGKYQHTIRTTGRYDRVEKVANTVVADTPGGPVFIRDVADVQLGYEKRVSFVRSEGRPVMAIPVRRETNVNVLRVMDGVHAAIEHVNTVVLAGRQTPMRLAQVYDETGYIYSAIGLVETNILYGGILAVMVLLLFLRSGSATIVVAISIPISIIGTFLMVTLLGRNLNVVMLAGMAFAVGMVVDNAIVVLENIYRHRQMGKPLRSAALEGATEVWGAVLASTLTTVVVFLPVITVEEEAGQLFRDIAVAIGSAVLLSLTVAMTVIPSLSARALRKTTVVTAEQSGGRVARWVSGLVYWINGGLGRRLAVVGVLATASLVGSWALAPPTDYLPNGNRNLVFGIVLPPPGLSLERFSRIGRNIEQVLRPWWQIDPDSDEFAELQQAYMQEAAAYGETMKAQFGAMQEQLAELQRTLDDTRDPDERASLERQVAAVQRQLEEGYRRSIEMSVPPPAIEDFFYVSFLGQGFMGAVGHEEGKARALSNLMNQAGQQADPEIICFFIQPSIFNLGGGNEIEVEVRGDDLTAVARAAAAVYGKSVERFGRQQVRTEPFNFNRGRKEDRFVPDRVRAAQVGMTAADIGFILRAAVDGAPVGEYVDRGRTIDLVVKIAGLEDRPPEQIVATSIVTHNGRVVPLASLVRRDSTTALQQIQRIEEQRAVTLRVQAPEGVPLATLQKIIRNEIAAPLREAEAIAPGVQLYFAGNADKLTQTLHAMVGEWTPRGIPGRVFGGRIPTWVVLLAAVVLIGGAGALFWAGFGFRSGMAVLLVGLAILVGWTLWLALGPDTLIAFLQSRFFIALLVVYLLMAALFESFTYPFVILFSVPLAAVGGFAGLAILHTVTFFSPTQPVQNFDVLTMLGFVILLGVVVNNAILIVHQTLNNIRSGGLAYPEAIRESVRTRVRPIFMSSLTSVFGMLPLVVMPGAGSELYRGLGAVVVGGLLVATMFTIVLVPTVLSLAMALTVQVRHLFGRFLGEAADAGRPGPAVASEKA